VRDLFAPALLDLRSAHGTRPGIAATEQARVKRFAVLLGLVKAHVTLDADVFALAGSVPFERVL